MTNRKTFLKALCSFCLIGAALCFVCSADSSSCSAQNFNGIGSESYNDGFNAAIREMYNLRRQFAQEEREEAIQRARLQETLYRERQARFNARFGNNPFEKPRALEDSGVETPEEREKFRKEWGFLPPNHTETEYREIGQTAIAAALFVELGAPASKAKEAKMEKLFRICKNAYDRANPNGPSFENALLKISENEYDWGMSNVEHKIHYANLARRYSIQHSKDRFASKYYSDDDDVTFLQIQLEDISEELERGSDELEKWLEFEDASYPRQSMLQVYEAVFRNNLAYDRDFQRYIRQKYGKRNYDIHKEFRLYMRKKLGDETYKEFMQVGTSQAFPNRRGDVDSAMDYLLQQACDILGI